MMADRDTAGSYRDDDHQPAYIFDPLDDGEQAARPPKRRKTSKRANETQPEVESLADFVPLFNGTEGTASGRRRRELFDASWSGVHTRIQRVLREANQTTLDEVSAFVKDAPEATSKIPAVFIITGPNVASQDLLFEQLAEELEDTCQGRFVRMRAAEASNLKAALKKIIRDATTRTSEDEEELEVTVGRDGRKYLDYDLEALHAFVKPGNSKRVLVAFEGSEAFDSGLLSDLIVLCNSWQNRIQFTLLFGIATSVELFQARLLKSTCRHLYGRQFDVVQSTAVVDSLFQCAIARPETSLRVGPNLLRVLVERQKEQVAGIQMFVNSLKYAHMCHFYANPLSVLSGSSEWNDDIVQPEHLESIRSLPSLRRHVEEAVDTGRTDHVKSLLNDDDYLMSNIGYHENKRQEWSTQLLRSLHLLLASGITTGTFTDLYISTLADGIDLSTEDSAFAESVRRMMPDEIVSLAQRLLTAVTQGSPDLGLEAWNGEEETAGFVAYLSKAVQDVADLKALASEKGNPLRSKYTAQSKVLRTTVVAQKVQLSRDSAALTEEDKDLTAVIDGLVKQLSLAISCDRVESLFLNELWLYDSKAPHKDVFVPRPGSVLGRALSKPHDYLACSCCGKSNGGIAPTLPATSILYHLYLEAGALVNVADLWSAFCAMVVEDNDGSGNDERTALVLFYRALAELRAMGFVKASRKKVDHIAKLKWL